MKKVKKVSFSELNSVSPADLESLTSQYDALTESLAMHRAFSYIMYKGLLEDFIDYCDLEVLFSELLRKTKRLKTNS
jgi:hypothetical protein